MRLQGGCCAFVSVIGVALAAGPASAGITMVGDPGGTTVIGARIQNGAAGSGLGNFKGEIFQSDPSSPNATMFAPGGNPAWNYGSSYNFEMDYTASTGKMTLSIDFGSGGGVHNIPVTFGSLVGTEFSFLKISATNNDLSNVTISNLSINGTSLVDVTTSLGPVSAFYANLDASNNPISFGDTIDVKGSFVFSASGGTVDIPRFDIDLLGSTGTGGDGNGGGGGQTGGGHAPEPSAFLTFGVLALIGGTGLLVRRRRLAIVAG